MSNFDFRDILFFSPAQFISKRVSDHVISGKIGKIVDDVRLKIKLWYHSYFLNILITIISNILLVGITLVSYYFFSVNPVVICIISCISIFMICRTIVRLLRSLVQTIIPHWNYISEYGSMFINSLFRGYGLSYSIRRTIRSAFYNVYRGKTNAFVRGVHTVFSKLRFIKSDDEICDEVVDEFYSLFTGYTVRLIVYKVIAFLTYIAVFNFFLRPYIFLHTLRLNAIEILIYPFTVALPAVINIIGGKL